MKILRYFTIVIAALGVGAVVTALSLSSKWQVEVSKTVNASAATIFPWINTLTMWPEWTVWNQNNHPKLQMTYEGEPAGKGAIQIWHEGKDTGRLEIVASEADQRVAYRLKMGNAFFLMYGEIRLTPSAAGTQVTWKVYGDSGPNLIARLMMLVFKPIIKQDLNGSLTELQAMLEQPSK